MRALRASAKRPMDLRLTARKERNVAGGARSGRSNQIHLARRMTQTPRSQKHIAMPEPVLHDVTRASHSCYARLKSLENLKTRGLFNLEAQAVGFVVVAKHQHPVAGQDVMAFEHQLIERFLGIQAETDQPIRKTTSKLFGG